jgi:hypothetical protein
MKIFSDKSYKETRNTLLCSIIFFFFENRAVCEIMWKNIVDTSRPQMTIRRMRIACWIPKTINTHTGYIILIVFALQQWSHKLASTLRFTYIACLFFLLWKVYRSLKNAGYFLSVARSKIKDSDKE